MALWQFGNGPGTHALVVGVGEYPWLLGGSAQPTFADHEGMDQLTSAPLSALRFAEWIAGSYASSTHPLRSLEVLISGPGQGPWEPRPGAGQKTPERARFADFKNAVLAWHGRLTAKDRAILFYSGHGIAAGYQQTLLLEDYGEIPAAALGSAFDFTTFREAMLRAPALEQCYFIDACRVSSGKLMRSRNRYGDPILDPSAAIPSPARKQAVLYATMPGAAAYGRVGTTSLFTEAVLKAMRGAGADQTMNGWTVRPGRLRDGTEHLLGAIARQYGSSQNCGADVTASFDLHELAGLPDVPVIVSCRPPVDVAQAKVVVTGASGNREQSPPIPEPWTFDLPVGQYSFVATPPGGTPTQKYVYPPCAEVELP